MKLVFVPRRHAVPVQPGERPKTQEENAAAIAEGRSAIVRELRRRFSDVVILGIGGKDGVVVELADDPALVKRIKSELDLESGPAEPAAPVDPDEFEKRTGRPDLAQILRDAVTEGPIPRR